MNFKNLFSKSAWKGTAKAGLMKLEDTSPEVMVTVGLISLLVGTVYACTKTEKAKEEYKAYKEANNSVKDMVVEGDEKQQKIEKGKAYVRNTGIFVYKMAKLYGGPALFWFGGAGLVSGGHEKRVKKYRNVVAELIATRNMFNDYRVRNAEATGVEAEQKIFMGAQQGKVKVLEKDPETGEEKIVEKKGDIFYAQPGSIFARNFTEETSDAFDIRSFADDYLDDRIRKINYDLECGVARAYTGLEILRMLGFNENALGEGESFDVLIRNGISGNGRKVRDPECRKLKVTRMRGYQKKWDVARDMEVYVPCVRLDFNFYPLEGLI